MKNNDADKTAGEQQRKVIGKPFKKGESGNPEGRPKGKGLSITALVKAELDKIPEGGETTNAAQIVQKILDKAIADGDSKMIEKIWAYIDGTPKDSVEISIYDPDKAIEDLEKQFE